MYLLWLVCVCWSANVMANRPEPYLLANATTYFEGFMVKYGRTYANDQEKNRRFEIFKSNLEKINHLNENGGAEFGITKFTDMTKEEVGLSSSFSNDIKGNVTANYIICRVLSDKHITAKGAPDELDWRAQGAVTSVRYQGKCNSCWAIAATGQLEARYYMKHKRLIELSPQQIVDCDRASAGCESIDGSMLKAYRAYLNYLGGAMKEVDYPYTSKTGPCRSDISKVVATLTRCFGYDLTSQEKVKQQLHKVGPLGIAIRSKNLLVYQKGIVADYHCDDGNVDHAVLLVGYGSENGEDYWLVKNSWGSDWGEGGYFRMQRGEDAESCGMMNHYMSHADVE